jgi:hypothetical protein
LTTSVYAAEKLSLDQIAEFLKASQEIRFEGETQEHVYHWIEQVLSQHEYPKQSRSSRGSPLQTNVLCCQKRRVKKWKSAQQSQALELSQWLLLHICGQY